jgi:hypothetical protein
VSPVKYELGSYFPEDDILQFVSDGGEQKQEISIRIEGLRAEIRTRDIRNEGPISDN